MQSLVGAPRQTELVDLVLKYIQNGRRRVTSLKLGGERMSGKILFGLFIVSFEGFFEDTSEIG